MTYHRDVLASEKCSGDVHLFVHAIFVSQHVQAAHEEAVRVQEQVNRDLGPMVKELEDALQGNYTLSKADSWNGHIMVQPVGCESSDVLEGDGGASESGTHHSGSRQQTSQDCGRCRRASSGSAVEVGGDGGRAGLGAGSSNGCCHSRSGDSGGSATVGRSGEGDSSCSSATSRHIRYPGGTVAIAFTSAHDYTRHPRGWLRGKASLRLAHAARSCGGRLVVVGVEEWVQGYRTGCEAQAQWRAWLLSRLEQQTQGMVEG